MRVSALRRDLQRIIKQSVCENDTIAQIEADLILLSELRPGSEDRTLLLSMHDVSCDTAIRKRLDDKCKRRIAGEPLAYILQQKEFYSNLFYVDSRVLIPRPETELLVSHAIEIITHASEEKILLLDLGAGSGAIILSVYLALNEVHRNKLTAVAIEKSLDAISVIETNALRFKVSEHISVMNVCMFDFLKSDTLRELKKGVDRILIISNPPYLDISDSEVSSDVRVYEPHEALFSNNEGYQHGMEILQIIAGGYQGYPQDGCRYDVLIEIGYNQGGRLLSYAQNFREFGFTVLKDLAGLDRVLYGKTLF